MGVGCGSKEEGAQFCLFEASDDTLFNFSDRGSLYTTNVTFGEVTACAYVIAFVACFWEFAYFLWLWL